MDGANTEGAVQTPRSEIYTDEKIANEYKWIEKEDPELFKPGASTAEQQDILYKSFSARGDTLQAAEFLTGRKWSEWDAADKDRLGATLTEDQKASIPAHMRQKLGI